MKPNDNFPKVSCLQCARDVKAAFLTRRRIIQSHRVLTNRINILFSRSSRPNINQTTTTSSSEFNAVNSAQTVSPSNTDRPLHQLRNIIDSYPNTAEQVLVLDNDSASTHELHEDESNDSFSETSQNNESTTVVQDSSNTHVKMDITNSQNLDTNNTNLHPDLFSDKNQKLQSLKLALNTKYSDMIQSYKQKINAWTLMNKKDQLNIIKWMEKKNVNTNSTNSKSKLTPVQHKKREPLKMHCHICQIKFTNKITYKNHMSRHKHKTCPVCNKQIRSAYLKRHMTLHEHSPAMCEVCGITCKNPVSLKMHFFYYHNSNLSVCEDCGRSFKTKTKLLYHQRKDHTKERNYKCDTCGKCFFAKCKQSLLLLLLLSITFLFKNMPIRIYI